MFSHFDLHRRTLKCPQIHFSFSISHLHINYYEPAKSNCPFFYSPTKMSWTELMNRKYESRLVLFDLTLNFNSFFFTFPTNHSDKKISHSFWKEYALRKFLFHLENCLINNAAVEINRTIIACFPEKGKKIEFQQQ